MYDGCEVRVVIVQPVNQQAIHHRRVAQGDRLWLTDNGRAARATQHSKRIEGLSREFIVSRGKGDAHRIGEAKLQVLPHILGHGSPLKCNNALGNSAAERRCVLSDGGYLHG